MRSGQQATGGTAPQPPALAVEMVFPMSHMGTLEWPVQSVKDKKLLSKSHKYSSTIKCNNVC